MEETIRPGTAEDLPQLLALYREYHEGLLRVGMNYDLNEDTLPRVLENRLRSRLILTAVAQEETGRLLGFVVEDQRKHGISPLYLVTDHIGFYEKYGWEFLCLAREEDSEAMTRVYRHS